MEIVGPSERLKREGKGRKRGWEGGRGEKRRGEKEGGEDDTRGREGGREGGRGGGYKGKERGKGGEEGEDDDEVVSLQNRVAKRERKVVDYDLRRRELEVSPHQEL